MTLYCKIVENYATYFLKYETSKNKLLSGILYGINVFSEKDLNHIMEQLQDYKDMIDSQDIAFELLMSLVLNYIAINMIYSLPHLINKPNQNSCCSTHIIFGESISQLVAFCLATESSNILNSVFKKNKTLLNKINYNISENDEVILNSIENNIKKETIIKDYTTKLQSLINKYKDIYKTLFKINRNK